MKQFGVFGLGKFGMSVARYFAEHGAQVIAVDKDEELVSEISDVATMAIRADVDNIETIKSLELGSLDAVVVCCGDQIGPNIMGIIAAKESGVKRIATKAVDERIASLYRTVGATDVVQPDTEMGERLARGILYDRYLDFFKLDSESSMAEMLVPDEWVGKSMIQLEIRKRYNISVIAFKKNDRLDFTFDPKQPFRKDQVIIVAGKDSDLEKIK